MTGARAIDNEARVGKDTGQRVLIVEDNEQTRELLERYLRASGFKPFTASDGIAGLRAAQELTPDLVLLDVMLPGLDGFSICRRLREEMGLPVVLLTARSTEDDRVRGLELGADDYIVKPYSPRELVARLRAVLRRVGRDHEPQRRSFAQLTASREQMRVTVAGEVLDLTPTEFSLIWCLLSHPSRVFTRAELAASVPEGRSNPTPRAIDTHIGNLRRKLSLSGSELHIQTAYALGYRLTTRSEGA